MHSNFDTFKGVIDGKKKDEAKEKLEKIIKRACGSAPSLMAKGNYGRAILKVHVAEKIVDVMPTQVSMI